MFYVFRGADRPTNYYLALITADIAPTHDTKDMSQLTQITEGNGYTDGGYALNLNSTDFTAILEDDTGQLAELQIKPVTWTADGGPLPASGDPALYIVLTTDDAIVANREVLWYEAFTTEQAVLLGQNLTVSNMKLRLQGGGMIKSLQYGTVDLTTTARTGTATITAVDTAKSVIAFLGAGSDSNSDTADDTSGARVSLTNATTVTGERSLTTTLGGVLKLGFVVTEYF
jgi:hypothetical protein